MPVSFALPVVPKIAAIPVVKDSKMKTPVLTTTVLPAISNRSGDQPPVFPVINPGTGIPQWKRKTAIGGF